MSRRLHHIVVPLLMLALIVGLAGACSSSGGCPAEQSGDSCTRVLFIGNSYTYVNDLPGVFAHLAVAGGHRVETGMAATGGATLADHVASPDTSDRLASARWSVVVLQEQSEVPAAAQQRAAGMLPAARTLVGQIRAAGARPMLFLTWAHRDGWPEMGQPGYETMQGQIDDGYLSIASALRVPVAPVGFAWSAARRQDPQLTLWQDDGSHPSEQGTYLAACVFYAAVFSQSPEGITYSAGLQPEAAREMQALAAGTVLHDMVRWGLR